MVTMEWDDHTYGWMPDDDDDTEAKPETLAEFMAENAAYNVLMEELGSAPIVISNKSNDDDDDMELAIQAMEMSKDE